VLVCRGGGVRVCGCAGVLVCGFAGVGVSRCAGVRVCGYAGVQVSFSYHRFMLGQPGVEEGLVPDRLQVGHHDVRRGHLHESGRRQGAGGGQGCQVDQGKGSQFAGRLSMVAALSSSEPKFSLKSCR
jgi:hypothetical protein